MMDRRVFLNGAVLAGLAAAQAKPHQYHLRYAPRVGLLPDLPVPRQLEIYAEWGFRAFEYNSLPQHSMTEIADLRKKREQLGMAMGVFVVNSGGWTSDALVDKKFHPGFLDDVRKAVEIHELMGNEAATVTTGLTVNYLSHEEQTGNCVEALKRAAGIVEGTKLMLALEPINSRDTGKDYFVVFSAHAAEIISRVNHPQVRILFDIYHQQISEGNLIANIRKHWNWIGYFQSGDVPGRKEPYTGEINYRNVFKTIHEMGYQGMIGMEHGLSESGLKGLEKCFNAYQKADSWEG